MIQHLRPTYTSATRRPAFSLAELVVAVGILVLMMSLAGEVFNFTVQSTGQATAVTDINRQLRMLEQLLRDDLRTVQPGQSLLLIQGNPVNAYWTQDGKDSDIDNDPLNGYAHIDDPQRERADGEMISPRADILTIFTARETNSFISPNISSSMQQIVYGHAELGEYVPDTTGGVPPYKFEAAQIAFPENDSYPDPEIPSPVSAQTWHLARRNVLLLPTATDPDPANYKSGLSWVNDLNAVGLADIRLLQGEVDIVGDFHYEKLVLAPWWPRAQWYLPQVFKDVDLSYDQWDKPFARSQLDVTPPALFANRLGHYLISNCASFKVEWTLSPRSEFVAGRLDAMKETYWFDPGAVLEENNGVPSIDDDTLIEIQNEIDVLCKQKGTSNILDNKLNRLEDLLLSRRTHTNNASYSLTNRFRSKQHNSTQLRCTQHNRDPDFDWEPLAPDQRANLVAFVANFPSQPDAAIRPGPSVSEDVPDDMFPGALRITVDLYDRASRLDKPIRHVMIIPVGG